MGDNTILWHTRSSLLKGSMEVQKITVAFWKANQHVENRENMTSTWTQRIAQYNYKQSPFMVIITKRIAHEGLKKIGHQQLPMPSNRLPTLSALVYLPNAENCVQLYKN